MGITRYLVVMLAMILFGSISQTHTSALHAYDAMHCLFHSSSDDPETCLLEGETTSCDTYKCFQTVGKRCSVEHDAKLTGYVCAKSLFCGCDSKCNGCMNVNGKEKCYWSENCMPTFNKYKRSQLKNLPKEVRDRNNIDYPIEDAMTV